MPEVTFSDVGGLDSLRELFCADFERCHAYVHMGTSNVVLACVCTSLFSWLVHVTWSRCLPRNASMSTLFIPEYELSVLMV